MRRGEERSESFLIHAAAHANEQAQANGEQRASEALMIHAAAHEMWRGMQEIHGVGECSDIA